MPIQRVQVLAAAVMLLSAQASQARISHGYTAVQLIDTVTAVDDATGTPPQATSLGTVVPNPFNPRTVITFELGATESTRLAIFDLGGRLVRVLVVGMRSAGRHEAMWDGRDDAGRAVPAGTYFCRLHAGHVVQTRRMTLVR